jgi:hypothetical protein
MVVKTISQTEGTTEGTVEATVEKNYIYKEFMIQLARSYELQERGRSFKEKAKKLQTGQETAGIWKIR